MRTDLGGLRRDPLRPELLTLDKEPKRNALRGNWLPLGIFPSARISQTVAQTIFGVFTTVTMDATTFDNDGIASLGTDQIIVKFPGLYAVWGRVMWAAVPTPGVTDTRKARLLINGVGTSEEGGWRVADAQTVGVTCQDVVSLARGGTIALQGFATAAGVATLVTSPPSALTVAWIGVPL